METSKKGPKAICYMVMPFGKKKVFPRPHGAPAEIDFDALWERAYWPAIEALGYLPIRGDSDNQSVIIKAMLERIAYADLVIADVTLGNGNVYYEVGIRHVAAETACVLVAADWSQPLFDIAQFASVRIPLKKGKVTPAAAQRIRGVLEKSVPGRIKSRNPYYELIEPKRKAAARRSNRTFQQLAEELNAFQSQVKAVRLEGSVAQKRRRLENLLDTLDDSSLKTPEVALDLVTLIRDTLDWERMRDFIGRLPPETRDLPYVVEQDLLALAKNGDPEEAVPLLKDFIRLQGDTPERSGLLGGRYKQLWRKARQQREKDEKEKKRKGKGPTSRERDLLDQAITSYQRGMELDYNQYYCSNNLALLLRERNAKGDRERAARLDHLVIAACERALKREEEDEWLRSTLLGAAFRAGDLKKAGQLAKEVAGEGQAQWKLDTTIHYIADSVRQAEEPEKQAKLATIFRRLEKLVPKKGGSAAGGA